MQAFQKPLDELLAAGLVGAHELVHGELLAGDSGGRRRLLDFLELLPWAPTLPHLEAASFAREHQLSGRGLAWIDLHLLTSTCRQAWRIWSADQYLAAAAAEMGIGWRP
jgi:hypothetical protein